MNMSIDSIRYYLNQFRRFGLAGLLGFFRRCFPVWRRIVFFYVNLIQHPFVRTERGITLIGNFTGDASDSKTMRDLAFVLKSSGVPYQTWNLDVSSVVHGCDIQGLLTPKSEFRLRRFSHVIELRKSHAPRVRGLHYGRIFFWEYESGLLQGNPYLDSHWDVIAMSDYNFNYYSKVLPKSMRVHSMLYPFRPLNQGKVTSSEMRKKYEIAEDDFVVFYNFALGCSRKNPEGCLAAFARAFAGDAKCRLLLKVSSAVRYPSELRRIEVLAQQLGIHSQLRIVSTFVSDAEIAGMTDACDVYMSLHRGEGFGLGMAEAMSLGKAVVATAYSANTEYCKADNSIQIPYKIVPIPPECDEYHYGIREWADPDIDVAAKALVELRQSPELRHRLGASAQKFVSKYFSIENVGRSIADYLERDVDDGHR